MKLVLECLPNLDAISANEWNQLVPQSNPFLRHEFLRGLEASDCVGSPNTGWIPRHLIVKNENNNSILAALPLYEKYDSYGEYIFDWSWARAAQGANIAYYPKLVSAIPFTPATCPKLLVHPNAEDHHASLTKLLIQGIREVANTLDASSIHVLFHPESECAAFEPTEFRTRKSFQYHWLKEPHWTCFNDYLNDMRSKNRKMIRRERRIAASHNLRLRTLRGPELTDAHWDALWEFYKRTTYFKGAIPYLTESFFQFLKTGLINFVVATFAENEKEPIAGALFFCDGESLFGRYWGTKLYLDCMHFELCYYQPIDWAIQNGITRFEAGAQGDHKLKRGFLPRPCYSSHWIAHLGLAESVYHFLDREALGIHATISHIDEHSPFK